MKNYLGWRGSVAILAATDGIIVTVMVNKRHQSGRTGKEASQRRRAVVVVVVVVEKPPLYHDRIAVGRK